MKCHTAPDPLQNEFRAAGSCQSFRRSQQDPRSADNCLANQDRNNAFSASRPDRAKGSFRRCQKSAVRLSERRDWAASVWILAGRCRQDRCLYSAVHREMRHCTCRTFYTRSSGKYVSRVPLSGRRGSACQTSPCRRFIAETTSSSFPLLPISCIPIPWSTGRLPAGREQTFASTVSTSVAYISRGSDVFSPNG